jgi:hypothetical protein
MVLTVKEVALNQSHAVSKPAEFVEQLHTQLAFACG